VSASLPGLRRSLGLPALVSYGLAYVAPITFFTTYGVATETSGGRLALAYLLATSGVLLTAFSYGHLAAVFPQAGSVYHYASRALHPRLGFLAGWAIALDYLMIPALNCIVIGVFGSALAPRIPAWLWGLAAIALTTAVNLRGIEATDRSARVVLALELLVIAAFLAAAVAAGPGPAPPRPAPAAPALLAGAALVALSFLGFDAITTLAEEAREPRRDVPRAVVLTCLGAGALFVLLSAATFRAHPAWRFSDADAAGFTAAAELGGRPLAWLVSLGEIVGSLASALAGQAGAARLLFGMAREGALGAGWLDHLHPARRTPDRATLLLAAVGLAGLALPLAEAVSLVNFGALLGFLLVNLSVIGHFIAREGRRGARALVLYGILPLAGATVVAALLWGLSTRAKLMGGLWLLAGAARLLAGAPGRAGASLRRLGP
jgi:amino acid transporter